jgi:hypothetical protein
MAKSDRRTVNRASEAASQTERAVLALREILLRGDFAAGQRLTELTLVARLGASRTPVRHALNRLAHEGLLEALPAGGFSVRQFTLADIWDAIEIRGALEGIAARLAAQRYRKPAELARLRAYCAEMESLGCGKVEEFSGISRSTRRSMPSCGAWRVARCCAQPRGDHRSPVRRAGRAGIRRKGAGRRKNASARVALEHAPVDRRGDHGTGWGAGREHCTRALARRPQQPDAGAPRPGTDAVAPGAAR